MVQLQYFGKCCEASSTIFLTAKNEMLQTDYVVEQLCLLSDVCVGTDVHCVMFFGRHYSAFMCVWVGTFPVSGHLCGCIYKELLTGAARTATESSNEL